MSDLRKYFAVKPKKETKTAVAPKKTSKRRIIESDDEDDTEPVDEVKAKKPEPKKQKQEESVEVSDYFSQHSARKTRSATAQAKPQPEKPAPKKTASTKPIEVSDDDFDDSIDIDEVFKDSRPTPKPAPKPVAKPAPKPASRPTSKRNTAENEDYEIEEVVPAKVQLAKRASRASSVRAPTASSSAKATVKKTTHAKDQPPPAGKTAEEVLAKIPNATLPEVDEEKKFSFHDFKARGDQPVLESDIQIPEARPACLTGLKILFTGVLPHLTREQCVSIVTKYKGTVVSSISSRTSVVVLGVDAGPSKIKKIKTIGTKVIDEDGFLQLLRDMPAAGGSGELAQKMMLKQKQEEQKINDAAESLKKEMAERYKTASNDETGGVNNELWTTKYAPTKMSEIIGNPGAVRKLQAWLANWKKNYKSGFKKPGPDGSGVYRAVIIHGPPGIGKTTAAHLVAKTMGFDVLENNASDTRSKGQLSEQVTSILTNTSIVGYFGTKADPHAHKKKKNLVLIMDEVDGMSAGDRGGVGQMAALCRITHVPIILICNERTLPKMRPFDRVTFDIPFRRPDANAARVRLMSIAKQENLKMEGGVIEQLVASTHADIRQIINIMSTYARTRSSLNVDESVDLSKASEKHTILKPFDILARFFSPGTFSANSRMTLNDKIELYFHDHDFTPLMVQENYLNTIPVSAGNDRIKHLEAVVNASESISDGDLVDARIHSSEQLWSLMPLHAVMSSVRPSSFVCGQGRSRYNFTSYLGNNSKRGKYDRLLQEIHAHMRLKISGDQEEVREDYMPLLTMLLLKPLMKKGIEGVEQVIEVMDDYYLTKEDWDVIMELGVGDHRAEEYVKKLPTAVKSGFTRKYNGMNHPVPFMKSASSVKVGVGAGPAVVPDLEETLGEEVAVDDGEGEDEKKKEEEEEGDLTKDKYIKVGKPKKAAAKKAGAGTKKRAATTSSASGSTKTSRGTKRASTK